MLNVRLTGARELTLHLRGMAKRAPEVARRIIGRSALQVKRQAQKNLSGPILHVRTGKLRSNIAISFGLDRKNPKAIIASNTEYGAIHEFGGTIRPRRAKYLAIPMTGVKGSPADYPHAFVIKLKGKLYVAMRGQYHKIKGAQVHHLRGAGLKVLFALRKQVKIPARPYMAPALAASIPAIDNIIKQEAGELSP